MFNATLFKKTNIGQYILYMWQIEDLLRAFDFDATRMANYVCDAVSREGQTYSANQKQQLAQWYESLADMLVSDGHRETGHLSMVGNTLLEMEELHLMLIRQGKDWQYIAAYREVQGLITILKSRSDRPATIGDIEMCMTFLYISMILERKGELSEQTRDTQKRISKFIGMLANRYKAWKDNDEEL